MNAGFIPETCGAANLYPAITPVNSSRLTFDACLGTEHGLLGDRTYWSSYEVA